MKISKLYWTKEYTHCEVIANKKKADENQIKSKP